MKLSIKEVNDDPNTSQVAQSQWLWLGYFIIAHEKYMVKTCQMEEWMARQEGFGSVNLAQRSF